MFSEPITVWSKKKTKKQSNIKFPVNRFESWSIDNRFIRIYRPAMIGENEEMLQKCEVWKRWRKSLQFSDMIISRCASLQK